FRDRTACNYGWCSGDGPSNGVTPGVKVRQTPGYRHNDLHKDPSQTIRLMFKMARLVRANGTEEQIAMKDVLLDKTLAPLASHEGTVTYLRQKSIPEPTETISIPSISKLIPPRFPTSW